jgi:hypothetical protein
MSVLLGLRGKMMMGQQAAVVFRTRFSMRQLGVSLVVALLIVPGVAFGSPDRRHPPSVATRAVFGAPGRLITAPDVTVDPSAMIPDHKLGSERYEVANAHDAASAGGPSAVSPSAAASPAFAGMTQVASGSGAGYPPDTILARGSGTLIEMVNRRARLFNSSGTVLATTTLNSFFGASGALLFDPKIVYDRGSQTYFAVALQGNDSASSNLYLAVSRPVNPTGLGSTQWCRYVFDTRLSFGSTATWADYPGLGLGSNTLVVSVNNFNDANPAVFQGSAIRAWSKLYYAANTSACPTGTNPYFWGGYGSPSQALPFTIQPALHYTAPTGVTGATQPVYLVNSNPGTVTYSIWKIANLSSGSPLLFGPLSVAGNRTIQAPNVAPVGANGIPIDQGDWRILQLAGVGNGLFAIHTNRCQFTSGTQTESCVRYMRFSVSNGTGGAIGASVGGQSQFGGGNGWYYSYPSIAVNNAGAAATAFNATQAGGFRGAAWATKPSGSSAFGNITYLAQGTCFLNATLSDDGTMWRAGDYSGAATDPDTTSIWVATERSTSISGVGCGWQTRIARITAI